jgi:hypothetical protein
MSIQTGKNSNTRYEYSLHILLTFCSVSTEFPNQSQIEAPASSSPVDIQTTNLSKSGDAVFGEGVEALSPDEDSVFREVKTQQ